MEKGLVAVTVNQARISIVKGDITQQDSDAIVNAANPSLMGGGGIDGAIHRAGGPAILAECKQIVAEQGQLPTGKAVITTGGKLKARHVIHTVGPIWHGGHSSEPELLASAYRRSLEVASENGLKSVAFPSISTGAYGYPLTEAAPIALKTVADFLKEHPEIELVRFVLFDGKTLAAYEEALKNLTAP